jgi:hypothetical protein
MKPLAAALGLVMALCLLGVAAIVVLAPSCNPWGGGPSPISGRFEIDTVTFELMRDASAMAAAQAASGPAPSGQANPPGIRIDTNTQLRGLWGGTVKSSKPYAIGFDSTDNAGDLERLEFTKIEITYNPSTPSTPSTPSAATEPAAEALALPITIDAREVEAVNSGAGGVIIRSTVRILSGEIQGVITRDEPLRLVIEGRFIKADGAQVPFTIDQYWDPRFERATKPAGEVLQDK